MANVLEIAAMSMATEMRRVEVSAQNIANVSTAGFKRQMAMASPFVDVLKGATSGLAATAGIAEMATATVTSSQVPTLTTRADLNEGRLAQTNNPMNLALTGPGFFTLRQAEQTLYSRAGAFERAANGRVINAQGAALQTEGGDLIVASSNFTVTSDGTVVEDGKPIGRLALVDIKADALKQRATGSAFTASANAVSTETSALVKQGYLEMANVDLGNEMVQMMETMRRFELGQKLMQAHEDMMDRSIRRLGDLQS